jgi:hypothetical protein
MSGLSSRWAARFVWVEETMLFFDLVVVDLPNLPGGIFTLVSTFRLVVGILVVRFAIPTNYNYHANAARRWLDSSHARDIRQLPFFVSKRTFVSVAA